VDREISRAVADGIVLAEDADNLREDMLADAGITDSSSNINDTDDDDFFGCTLSTGGRPDPVFPALVVIALLYLTRHKWQRVRK
jgi:hypothetical protein